MTSVSQAFVALQDGLLRGTWADVQFEDPVYQRWQQAARHAHREGHPAGRGSLDVATLTRQILRRETERSGQAVDLAVPHPTSAWPDEAYWQACGVTVRARQELHMVVRAEPWTPPFAGGADPTAQAMAQHRRGEPVQIPADPLFEEITGFGAYSSAGQQQALRAVWFAAPGATIITVLPTGTGKSAVAHVPALSAVRQGRLSVMVVPTVALALDQERALQALALTANIELPAVLAFHGGLTAAQRQAYLERIQSGTQGIIITSPEQLVSSLSGAMYRSAEAGQLAYLTLDEAHLATQWGADFRPEFQTIAGLRRALLDAAPPEHRLVTMLLTATLTDADLHTLRGLFGQPGPCDVIAAVKLRPEIEYWSAALPSAEERRAAVLEAVLHAPKPVVVYTTRVRDAKALHAALTELGLSRVGLLHGECSTEERVQVVRGWRAAELDVVVGTAAFGVGIDQAHVRAVIHACVPESADRYYQEVGRGGRDGRTSLALTLTAPQDWDDAARMAERQVITVERGLQRWRRMFQAAQQLTFGVFRVDMDLNPADLTRTNERSRMWNVNTLNLMARAGLIRLQHMPPPRRGPKDDERLHQRAWDEHHRSHWVEILDPFHLEDSTWEARVEPVRKEAQREARRSLRLLEQVLKGEREVSEVLCDVYQVHASEAFPLDAIYPQPACGGCPVCRSERRLPDPGVDPHPVVVHWQAPPADLGDLMSPGRVTMIEVRDEGQRQQWLRRLISRGVQVLIDPDRTLHPTQLRDLQLHALRPLLVERSDLLLFTPPLASVLLAPSERDSLPDSWLEPSETPRLILHLPHHTITDGGEPLSHFSARFIRAAH
ncbi:protein DpdF [Deinococcus sp. LM3]|uniref:protein DpdF n=1 Tax=Deinococcus sp. LM3 TaxID=1938608 RepID=UPI0009920359|nr:protein DpdF [Deinococcus sp. LM3]OOV12021.1 hypothetical protein BXU09_18915 [Deinococcus sp. LM3]